MRIALIIVILLMLSSLFAAESAQPLYFIDNEIYEYGAVLIQDSTIYAFGNNKDDLFLYEFDQQLDLQSKVKISKKLWVSEFFPYQDGFLTINRSNSKFTYINKQGEILDQLTILGPDRFRFEKDGQKHVITRKQDRLSLYTIGNELSRTEERLILETELDSRDPCDSWEIYFDKTDIYIFYKNKKGIMRYSFKDDWVFYHQEMIINIYEERYYEMKIEKNRVILSKPRSDKCIIYDFEGYITYEGSKEGAELQKEIVFTNSELRDALSIVSPNGEFNFELFTDFCFKTEGYALIDNQKIVLAGSKSYFPDWEMFNESLIMVLDSSKSELYLQQSRAADSLEAAYIDNDPARLTELFSNWQMKNSPETRLDGEDYEREAYLLFSQVYPKLYKYRKKQGSKYHSIEGEIEIILTNKIRIVPDRYSSIAGTIKPSYRINDKIVLTDFHPEPHIKKEIIFLDKQITKDLLVYLSRSGIDDEDLINRMSFIKKYISIEGFSWSGKPDIYSQPQIVSIIFESDFTRALVSYKKAHIHRSFFCNKKKGKWKKEKDTSFRVY
ncbi:MAG: hypothetical protein P9M05_08830 [Candidatus Stygibacter australis]|nr:hypothetical protein [Candidatus Stygibacter australis]